MSGRVEKANANRKVSCKKIRKIKAYKMQREKKHNKDTILIINISVIISLSNITIAVIPNKLMPYISIPLSPLVHHHHHLLQFNYY